METTKIKSRRDYLTSLSKVISHALRHEPWLYELELDEEGWVPLEELISVLQQSNKSWENLSKNEIEEMIAQSEKKRHEIRDDKIRALYGHSIPGKLKKELSEPPEILYHGTSPEAAEKIKTNGILPMSRQYVHLSVDRETAMQVGKRKSSHPIILKIHAKEAFIQGVKFYYGNELVWLADHVPAEFIEL